MRPWLFVDKGPESLAVPVERADERAHHDKFYFLRIDHLYRREEIGQTFALRHRPGKKNAQRPRAIVDRRSLLPRLGTGRPKRRDQTFSCRPRLGGWRIEIKSTWADDT